MISPIIIVEEKYMRAVYVILLSSRRARQLIIDSIPMFVGYLMSAFHGARHPATYECVDGSPEYVTGQQGDVNGALFYFVRASCATGLCPPYSSDKWIQCVVCTK